ncbi:MAG TPA: ribosomal protein S18-alanine N-acetyltransferase [Methylibium sp.]|nr:ribosomal protein S18-alanine N-acetyltransferase [Methylibium sp.]
MNAVVDPFERTLLPLREADLDAVLLVERAAYEFPWTRGNFTDSLRAGYDMQVLWGSCGARSELVGYFIAMIGVDEMHLLNLTVSPAHQGRGHARFMLDALGRLARRRHALQLWLEVRVSNVRARRLYERYGFADIGCRRGYYPAAGGTREDAVMMSLPLVAGALS